VRRQAAGGQRTGGAVRTGEPGTQGTIRLRQLSAESGREVSVCVLEKGSEVGAHILSGAVLEPIFVMTRE
jgi:electron-transferring-flavoprotein dehydrogenase